MANKYQKKRWSSKRKSSLTFQVSLVVFLIKRYGQTRAKKFISQVFFMKFATSPRGNISEETRGLFRPMGANPGGTREGLPTI